MEIAWICRLSEVPLGSFCFPQHLFHHNHASPCYTHSSKQTGNWQLLGNIWKHIAISIYWSSCMPKAYQFIYDFWTNSKNISIIFNRSIMTYVGSGSDDEVKWLKTPEAPRWSHGAMGTSRRSSATPLCREASWASCTYRDFYVESRPLGVW